MGESRAAGMTEQIKDSRYTEDEAAHVQDCLSWIIVTNSSQKQDGKWF